MRYQLGARRYQLAPNLSNLNYNDFIFSINLFNNATSQDNVSTICNF